MMQQDVGQRKDEIDDSKLSAALSQQMIAFLAPLLVRLDAYLDKRLVRTFVRTLDPMLIFRQRPGGLLLSELGAFITSPAHAPAGTKRLGNLIRSPRWSASLLDAYHWHLAQQRQTELEAAGEASLVIWDTNELEKAESRQLEGLCAVRSLKAARLTRHRPGFTQPPLGHKRVFVPSCHWLSLMVSGMSGPPTLAAMRWWTSRGPLASDMRTEEGALVEDCRRLWVRRVRHVFDRGFAGNPWLTRLRQADVRFVLRSPGRYHLLDAQGRDRPA